MPRLPHVLVLVSGIVVVGCDRRGAQVREFESSVSYEMWTIEHLQQVIVFALFLRLRCPPP
jgi:hypothetical protein